MQIMGNSVYLGIISWQKAIPNANLAACPMWKPWSDASSDSLVCIFSSFKGSTWVRGCVKSSYYTAQRIVSSLDDLNHQSNKGEL